MDSFELKTSLLRASRQEALFEDRDGEQCDRLLAGNCRAALMSRGPSTSHGVKRGDLGCLGFLKLTLNTTDSKMSLA